MHPSFIQSAVNRFLCTMHLVWVSPRPHSSWFHRLWPLNHSLGVFTCFLVQIKTAGSPFLALRSLSCGYGSYQAFRLFTALSSMSVVQSQVPIWILSLLLSQLPVILLIFWSSHTCFWVPDCILIYIPLLPSAHDLLSLIITWHFISTFLIAFVSLDYLSKGLNTPRFKLFASREQVLKNRKYTNSF